MRKLLLIPLRLLDSVVFGIVVMALVALYIAVGSGMAQVREMLEMNEMQFFNFWPLKLLMAMLVANLATVTIRRIPFTPTRYGVWMIHTGIVVLIFGMAYYYRMKVEGSALVPLQGSATNFYDQSERMLYIQLSGPTGDHWQEPIPLEDLPRFRAYAPELGNDHKLNRQSFPIRVAGQTRTADVSVAGYYPYANILTQVQVDPSAGQAGVKVTFRDPISGQFTGGRYLLDEGMDEQGQRVGLDLQHRSAGAGLTLETLKQMAKGLHRLDVRVAGQPAAMLDVEPGQTYSIGQTGYTLEVEGFIPQFPRSNGQIASLLTLKVTRPDKTAFRRQVIAGDALQTDFQLEAADPHGFGARQKEPLDKGLVVLYTLNDPQQLAPRVSSQRHVLITGAEPGSLFDVATSVNKPTQVTQIAGGSGEVQVDANGLNMVAKVERVEHVRRVTKVEQVPPHQRDRDEGASGGRQVLLVKLHREGWTQTVALPFTAYAGEPFQPWSEPVGIPNTPYRVSFKFGNTMRPLPAILWLEQFRLESYPGGGPQIGMQRDFQSTLRVEDLKTGRQHRTTIKLNDPMYYTDAGGTKWLFFQSGWDQQGEASGRGARWTIIGVGNRSGVTVMTTGSIMIGIGLLWAFYVKPVIIHRRKRRALQTAQSREWRGPRGAPEQAVADSQREAR